MLLPVINQHKFQLADNHAAKHSGIAANQPKILAKIASGTSPQPIVDGDCLHKFVICWQHIPWCKCGKWLLSKWYWVVMATIRWQSLVWWCYAVLVNKLLPLTLWIFLICSPCCKIHMSFKFQSNRSKNDEMAAILHPQKYHILALCWCISN